jgi:hypothetical protein
VEDSSALGLTQRFEPGRFTACPKFLRTPGFFGLAEVLGLLFSALARSGLFTLELCGAGRGLDSGLLFDPLSFEEQELIQREKDRAFTVVRRRLRHVSRPPEEGLDRGVDSDDIFS